MKSLRGRRSRDDEVPRRRLSRWENLRNHSRCSQSRAERDVFRESDLAKKPPVLRLGENPFEVISESLKHRPAGTCRVAHVSAQPRDNHTRAQGVFDRKSSLATRTDNRDILTGFRQTARDRGGIAEAPDENPMEDRRRADGRSSIGCGHGEISTGNRLFGELTRGVSEMETGQAYTISLAAGKNVRPVC